MIGWLQGLSALEWWALLAVLYIVIVLPLYVFIGHVIHFGTGEDD